MTRKQYYTLLTPFLFFFVVLFDGQLTMRLFSINHGAFSMNSHLLVLCMLLYLPYGSKMQNILYALGIGIISDIYFIGILGISSFGFPILMLLFYHLFEKIEENIFTVLLCYTLAVILLETVSYSLQVIFQLINGNVMLFITGTLGPTILLNLVLFLVFLFPLKWLYPIVAIES